MRIQSSSVQMHAQHSLTRVRQDHAEVQTWGPSQPQVARQQRVAQLRDQVDHWDGLGHAGRLQLALGLLRDLWGMDLEQLLERGSRARQEARPAPLPVQGLPPGWGISIEASSEQMEAEQVRLQAQGRLQLEDGREIEFQLQVSMERVDYQRTSLSLEIGTRRQVDPLFVSLDGSAPRLTADRVSFDLDADGRSEQLASSATPVLALDRNRDGLIQDGREVVGAMSGDAFADLRALDADGNGWIDAADLAWSQLRLLHLGSGDSQSLAQAGVGALSTFALSTPFQQAGLGEVTHSGLVIGEDGRAGLAQHIDLWV